MNSIKLKKNVIVFAALISFSCFTYLNFIVEPPIADNTEIKVDQELNAPNVIAPDLQVVSQFIEIGKRVFVQLR